MVVVVVPPGRHQPGGRQLGPLCIPPTLYPYLYIVSSTTAHHHHHHHPENNNQQAYQPIIPLVVVSEVEDHAVYQLHILHDSGCTPIIYNPSWHIPNRSAVPIYSKHRNHIPLRPSRSQDVLVGPRLHHIQGRPGKSLSMPRYWCDCCMSQGTATLYANTGLVQ